MKNVLRLSGIQKFSPASNSDARFRTLRQFHLFIPHRRETRIGPQEMSETHGPVADSCEGKAKGAERPGMRLQQLPLSVRFGAQTGLFVLFMANIFLASGEHHDAFSSQRILAFQDFSGARTWSTKPTLVNGEFVQPEMLYSW